MVMSKADFNQIYSKTELQKAVDSVAYYVDNELNKIAEDGSLAGRNEKYNKFCNQGVVVAYETDYYGESSWLGDILDNYSTIPSKRQEVRDAVVKAYNDAGWNASWHLFKHDGVSTGVLRIKL